MKIHKVGLMDLWYKKIYDGIEHGILIFRAGEIQTPIALLYKRDLKKLNDVWNKIG